MSFKYDEWQAGYFSLLFQPSSVRPALHYSKGSRAASHQDQSMASDPSAWLDTLRLLPRASSEPLPGIATICKGLLPLIYGALIANSKKRASGSGGGRVGAQTGRRAALTGAVTTKSKLLTRSRLLTRLILLTRANSQVSGRRLAWLKSGTFVSFLFSCVNRASGWQMSVTTDCECACEKRKNCIFILP